MFTLFDLVPKELFPMVLYHCDCQDFFTLIKLYPDGNYLELARKKVGHQTGLRTDQFDMKKLEELIWIRYPRNISAGSHNSYIVTLNH